MGDTGHGVVGAAAFEAAVAEDLPGLHPGEDMLDAGAHLLVCAVVRGLPLGELAAGLDPVNGLVQECSDAVVTRATARSRHRCVRAFGPVEGGDAEVAASTVAPR
ncbi:hypothetical protein [Kitasatospora sp. NPDC090308]|uniref:hypothetical protein n=1 Tax=Kitasatospora sp. NPDC090308 TaxID=3364082 RepID=UPI00381DDDAD